VKSEHNRIKYVFNSLEIDILPSGFLAIDDEALNILDFALVSIHSSFNQSRENNTKRVLLALSHPKAKIFSHPTTRKIGQREGIELNWPEIFDYCVKNNKWIEINADPMRLDLPDILVREAIKTGVKLVLGTDSHHKNSMDNMKYGVSVARRGWATTDDLINTQDLIEFKKMLK
jgi:DNA polymerase (family 10)